MVAENLIMAMMPSEHFTFRAIDYFAIMKIDNSAI